LDSGGSGPGVDGGGGTDGGGLGADAAPSPDGSVQWVKLFGTAPAQGIATDSKGNTIAVGQLTPATDAGVAFDDAGTLTTVGGGFDVDILVVKLDPSGNTLWARSFGGTGADVGEAVAVDDADDVYIAGHFSGAQLTIKTALTGVGLYTGFVAKLSGASGTPQWDHTFAPALTGTSKYVMCPKIAARGAAVAVACNISAAGLTYSATGGPQTVANADTTGATTDMFVANLDRATGNAKWADVIGGGTANETACAAFNATYPTAAGNDRLNGLALAPNGDVLIAGESCSHTISDLHGLNNAATLGPNGTLNGFVARLASGTGVVAPSTFIGGATGSARAQGISVGPSGTPVIAGAFNGTVKFGNANSSVSSGTDAFVWGYDDAASTNTMLATFGGAGIDGASNVSVDRWGDVVASGAFGSTSLTIGGIGVQSPATQQDLNNGPESYFVAKFSPTGTALWAHGVTSNSSGDAIAPTGLLFDGQGRSVSSLLFQGTADLGKGGVSSLKGGSTAQFAVIQYAP
jgi:hypothetical protein